MAQGKNIQFEFGWAPDLWCPTKTASVEQNRPKRKWKNANECRNDSEQAKSRESGEKNQLKSSLTPITVHLSSSYFYLYSLFFIVVVFCLSFACLLFLWWFSIFNFANILSAHTLTRSAKQIWDFFFASRFSRLWLILLVDCLHQFTHIRKEVCGFRLKCALFSSIFFLG